MTLSRADFLVALADQLDQEGMFEDADLIDENFQEFLDFLESGEFTFDPQFSGGARDPRQPYSNKGSGPIPAFGVPGPQ